MSRRTTSLQTLAALVLATGLGWGLIAPVTRLCFNAAPSVLDGATFTIARGTWTALAWLPAFLYLVAREWRAFDRETLLRLLALGALWGPGVMGTFAVATERTALAHVVFSVGLSPVSAGLFATLAFGGRSIGRVARAWCLERAASDCWA